MRVISVGIIGGSGFTGAELLRLCAGHPQFEVEFATADTQAGLRVGELYPSLAGAYPDLVFVPYEAGLAARADLVFLGLPHGASQAMVPELLGTTKWIIDLAADFRLRDAGLYPPWYGEAHAAPELLADFVYGLPELFRADLRAHRRLPLPVAIPRTAALALAPLARIGSRREAPASSSTPPAVCRAQATGQADQCVLHRRRGLHRLRAAESPAHPRDRTVAHALRATTSRCCSLRTWPR